MTSIRRELEVWSRGEFPRGVAIALTKEQIIRFGYVIDLEEILAFLNRNNDRDLYANVFSYGQIEAGIYDTMYLDIDSHLYDPARKMKIEIDKEEVYGRFLEVIEKLEDAGLKYRTYFSGRGFHVYVDFEPIYLENFGRAVLMYMNEVLGSSFGYVDTKPLIDRNRVARIPYSYNSKANLYAIPISPNWDLDTIIENAKYRRGFRQKLRRNDLEEDLLKYDSIARQTNEEFRQYVDAEKVELIDELLTDVMKMPKCIRDAIRELIMTGELDHYRRLHLAAFLLRVWSFDDVLELFSLANDFDERKTRYQLNYVLRRGILPYSCQKAEMLGICTASDQEQCLWKRLSNNWIGSIFVDKTILEEVNDNEEDGNNNDKQGSA